MGLSPDESGAGLAFLVSQGSRGMVPATSLCSTLLPHVFGLPEATAVALCENEGEIDYQQLHDQITRHIAEHVCSTADACTASSSSGVARQTTGRLGPRDAAIDRQSVCGNFSYSSDNLTLESYGNFSSCRANVAVFKGKWCYECTVLTPGIQQIGWATIHCPFTTEEGVGDAPDSYAVDGKRQRKWSVKPQPYGEAWVQGDVIGCAIDLDAGTITFYRNGQSMGVAYNRVRVMQPSLAYFPAVSLSHTERCRLNFGAKPFVYPMEGYQPLQAPPSQNDRVTAEYYCSCLGRLVRLAAEQQADRSSSSSSSSSTGSSGGSSCHATGHSSKASDRLQPGVLEAAAASSPVLPAAALAAAGSLGLGLSCPNSCSAARTSGPGVWSQAFAGATVSSADIILLGALVLQPLQHLLVGQPYLVHSALLPLLLELQHEGETAGQQRALQQLLQLMLLVWDQQDFNTVMVAVLEELAYRCQVSPLLAQDFPDTAGYPFLALAVSLLQHPVVMRLFVSHPDFTNTLEALLARKSPSPKDLQALLPHIWWKGCKDETASEERLKASVSIITATLAKVEQRQYELMEQLLSVPFQEHSCNRNSSSSAGADTEADCALVVFLRLLLQKNRAALRDVPPPGLSEPTVLMTTFFGLLRLLQPALHAAQTSGTGPLAAFPAAQLLAGANAEAEGLPVFDVPRLGGIVSHLSRENPLSDAEQEPIAVVAVHQQLGKQQQQQSHVIPAALHDAWVPELLNSCLLLYAWRVGFSYKMIHSLSSSVASSSTTLDELDRMIAAGAESGESQQASSWLLGTRKVYLDELTRDVRLLTLLRAAFFSPAKQQSLGCLSSYLARLLANIAAIPPPPPAAVESAEEQTAREDSATAAAPTTAADASSSSTGGRRRTMGSDAGAPQDDQPHLSNLLRYMPVVYAEVVVDYLTALRRLEEQQAAGTDTQAADYTAYVTWLCSCLDDPRIANPDVQENLLQVVGLLLEHGSFRAVLEAQPERARQLLAALLLTFDSRLWHPASSVLLKVIKNCGFGHLPQQQQSPHSLQQLLLELIDTPTVQAAAAGPEAAAGTETAAAASRTKGFFNKLFNTLNWTLTEFTVSVDGLHSLRGRRSILEAQNQYRRTGLMFELSVNFMRTLEFVVPTKAFIGGAVNRIRLRELLQFVLSHFTNGPDARRLNELLQDQQAAAATTGSAAASRGGSTSGSGSAAAGPAAAVVVPLPGQQAAAVIAAPAPVSLASVVPAYANQAMRFESNSLSERVQKPQLLAPVMGILLSLWDAHKAEAAGGGAAAADDDDVLDELAAMADERFMAALRFMQDVDWSAAFPSTPLSAPLRAFAQLLDTLAAARAAHESAAATALPDDVPDDFLDPITMDVMKDPVRLPDSQIVVDRGTIERHLLSSETDPFSRAPLKVEQLQPDEELKTRIQQWLAQAKTAAKDQQQQ